MGGPAMNPDDVSPAEFRLRALTDGWFAALDNLHEMPQEKHRSEVRTRAFAARTPGNRTESSVRHHRFGLQMNLFKEQREWVHLGEEIELFPRGAAKYLDDHFLLNQYANWVDPALRYGAGDYSPLLEDPDHFTRAYARAVAGLTAAQLGRIHLTHFASADEWHLALAEIQVLRATMLVHPQDVAAGNVLNQYNLYWFVDSYETYENEKTPSSWRDGNSWPGVEASMRLDVLRREFASFESDYHAAVASSLEEGAQLEFTGERSLRRLNKSKSNEISEKRLLAIARENEFDLERIREQIVRVLRGKGHAWLK